MASIKLRKKTWFAIWYDNGRQVMRTTNIRARGEREKKLAQNAADAMEQAAKGNIPVSQAMGALRKIATTLGFAKKIPSIAEYLRDYKIPGKESHQNNVKRTINLFLEHLGFESRLTLDLLTPRHCRDFIEKQLKRVSLGTAKIYKSNLQNAFQIAVEDEIIERNPFSLVSMKRVSSKNDSIVLKRKPFTMEEIKLMINIFPAPWRELVILCVLTGGQRLGDIACLKWSQIKWDEGIIVIRTMKTGKVIATPITNALKEVLTPLYNKYEEYVLPEAARRYTRSRGALSAEFVSLLKAAGIVDKTNIHLGAECRQLSDKSFHSLRHSVVSMLRVNPSFTTDLIRDTVGHDCEAVERNYFTADVSAKRSVIDFLAKQISLTE
jgi:integrase